LNGNAELLHARSGVNGSLTESRAAGTCGEFPLPGDGQGYIDSCSKNQDAMWTVCNVQCGINYPELYTTTRENNKPYRYYQCQLITIAYYLSM